ncbi:hypothetical protein ACJBXP_10840, partial [Streptococcus suis]
HSEAPPPPPPLPEHALDLSIKDGNTTDIYTASCGNITMQLPLVELLCLLQPIFQLLIIFVKKHIL